jgi:Tfp pilus assembly protein PilV
MSQESDRQGSMADPGGLRRRRLGLDRAGTTLIEVLIASVMVGAAAVGLALMYAQGHALIAGEGDNRVAMYLAQQKIERSRALGYASSSNAPGTITETLDQALQPPTALSDPVYWTRTTVIDCVQPSNYSSTTSCSATTPKRVTASVQSTPASQTNQKARQVTLTCLLIPS